MTLQEFRSKAEAIRQRRCAEAKARFQAEVDAAGEAFLEQLAAFELMQERDFLRAYELVQSVIQPEHEANLPKPPPSNGKHSNESWPGVRGAIREYAKRS